MTASPRYPFVNDKFRERFASLPDKLRAHIFRVRDVGLDLASRHGIDEERAELAILGHDVARAAKKDEILRLADRFGISTLDIERRAPVTLHGPVGAELLRHEDGLDDGEILAAVRWHTTGHHSLTPLGLLVFIADKLEPRKIKSYPYQRELQHIANESLSQAVLEFLCRETALRLQGRRPVHPASVAAINSLLMANEADRPRRPRAMATIGAAVRWHTTGHHSLTPLGLLVFIADKLEHTQGNGTDCKIKSYPYQRELQHIANESLSQAVLEFLCRETALRLQGRFLTADRCIPPASRPSTLC